MKISRKKNNQGQSLMETILAIGLVTSVILGALGLGIYSVRVGRYSQNQLLAANLAREALEYVRNVRDSNWLKGQAWNTGLITSPDCYNVGANWCTLDFNASTNTWTTAALAGINIDTCTQAQCELKTDLNYYTYTLNPGGNPTGFRRVFQIQPITVLGIDELQVTVKVKWFEKNSPRYLNLFEVLTDWRP